MSKCWILVVLALVAVVALPGDPARGQGKRMEKVTLRAGWFASGEQAPFALGVKRGFYEAEGIDLQILEGRGSGTVIQSMAAGSERFGYVDAYAMAAFVAKGLPVKMIANFLQTTPSSVIYFADSGIKAPKDLEGRKIAMSTGDANHQAFPALLERAGVDKSKVQEVLFDPRNRMTAVLVGQADAMTGFYPNDVPRLEEASKKKVGYFRYADYGVSVLTLGLVIPTKNLDEKDLNCRMVRASSRAWAEAAQNPDEAARALVELFPKAGTLEIVTRQWRDLAKLMYTERTKGKAPGWMAAEDWQDLLELQKRYAGITHTRPLAEYYTDEFFACPR
jgi:NitT/TauT family transport system substrate-binding protein